MNHGTRQRGVGVAVLAAVLAAAGRAADVPVRDAAELRTAVAAARPGARLLLAPGD